MNESSDKLHLIAYCGLYCPKCHKMKKVALAKEQLKKLGNKDLILKDKLDEIINSQCTKFCREGGGKSATCLIKLCCVEHQINGCWECEDFNICKKLKPQFIENNKKLKELGINNFIKQYK